MKIVENNIELVIQMERHGEIGGLVEVLLMIEKNFPKGTDLYEYSIKIEDFFNDKFGKLVAKHIWEIYQKKLGIDIKKIKTVNEFMTLSNTIIEEVFSKHKNNEEVESIKMELNMGFYVSQVKQGLNEILKENLDFEDISIRSVTKRYTTTHINSLENLSIIKYNINGIIEASAFLIFDKESLKDYIEEFSKTIFKKNEDQKEMFEKNLDMLTKEFCNVLVNNFSDTIANTLKQTINPLEDNDNDYYNFEKGKKRFLNEVEREEYSKIIKVSTIFKYSIIKSKIRIFFFIKKSKESISNSINKLKLEKDIPEDKREISIKNMQNELFDFLKKYLEEVNPFDFRDSVLNSINKKFITEITHKDIKNILLHIEKKYLNEKTIVTKTFILNGINNLLEKFVEINKKYSK
ncbi:MAG: hypothetical protein PHT94_03060 [Candidatus Nanoarchaeia archaeon]|nr:hypothetical protein [Candidatus Nanoarchaeia archaeon]